MRNEDDEMEDIIAECNYDLKIICEKYNSSNEDEAILRKIGKWI